MKRRIIQVLVGIFACLGVITVAEAAQFIETTPPAAPDNPIALRGCVIRFDTLNAAGTLVVPRIYADTNHICVGVTAVSVEPNGDLRITNTGGSNQVVTVWAAPDETLAAKFSACGVSGGSTTSIVRCYFRADGSRVEFDLISDVYGAGSNIWFGGMLWDD